MGDPNFSLPNGSEYTNDTFVSSATPRNTFVAGHSSRLSPDVLIGDQGLNSHIVGHFNLDQTNTTWVSNGYPYTLNTADGLSGYALPALDAQGIHTLDEFASFNGHGNNFLNVYALPTMGPPPTIDGFAIFNDHDKNFLNGYVVPPATAAQGPPTIDGFATINGHGGNSLPVMDLYGSNFIQPQFINNVADTPTSLGAPVMTPSISPMEPATPSRSDPATVAPGARYACAICKKTFRRPSDLQRHEGKHRSGPKKFDCPSERCAFKAERGFYRKDKMVNHVKNRHPEIDVHGL